MSEECLFCKIINKEIPAAVVHEDDLTLSFLDIFPINPGHTLVISKLHEPEFHKLPSADYRAVFDVVQKISHAIEKAFSPKRVGLMVQGWDVPHAHIHVVPMNEHGDVTSKKILEHTRGKPSSQELQGTADILRSHITR